jgi:D-sedoheptulose 7-phosphate isomerase
MNGVTATFVREYLRETVAIIDQLDVETIDRAASLLARTRQRGGRLFIIGVGGSAANSSHAVNDFRKIAGIEAYAPTDNVSELTARINDDGWATVFEQWLRTSHLQCADTLLVLSVGGGNLEKNISPNIVAALRLAKKAGAQVIGIVGRDGGYTGTVADALILVPTVNVAHITPHTEAFQGIIWHLLVSHPLVKIDATKWESVTAPAPQSRRAVFLDRDGVLNRAILRNGKPYPPTSVEQLEVLVGVPDALHELKRHDFELVVVSNQPDVARGTLSHKVVEQMNQRLKSLLPLDEFFVCYHTDEDKCTCRKPKPGLLLQAAEKLNIDLPGSFMVGDRWRDIEAGQTAGCKTVLIDNDYDEKSPAKEPDLRVNSLSQAARWIIQQHATTQGRAA